MPKNTIHDILPPSDRRPSRIAPELGDEGSAMKNSFVASNGSKQKIKKPKSGRRGRLSYVHFAVGLILILVIVGLVLTFVFGGATITVSPKQQAITVSGDFTAVSTPTENTLLYQTMKLESQKSAVVEATGREEVERKASGEIIVYNDYNSVSQRLIRNTRFETPDGNIYRIDKSVTVPGKSGDIPGSIEVTVYADEAGESYNAGLTDFTIPGFSGSPQFESFYARSKTEMTGGFIGEQLVVEDAELAETQAKLRTELRNELLETIELQDHTGFLTFNDVTFIEFTSEPQVESGESVEVTEKAVIYSVLFDELQLANFVASNTLGGFDGGPVAFLDTSNLRITVPNKEEIEPWIDTTFEFSMSGGATMVWLFNEERLKQDLSGRNKAALPTILSGYPGIAKGEGVLRPFWARSFPEDVAEIEIKVVLQADTE